MNMISFLYALLLSSAIVCQAAGEPKELTRLKEDYITAVERATIPLRKKYEDELRNLMEEHTKAAQLEVALSIKAELDGTHAVDGGGKSSKLPERAVQLKMNYVRACERTLDPINKTLKTELEKLLDKFSRAGELEAAVATKHELAELAKKSPPLGASAATSVKNGKISTAQKKQIEKWLVGKTWTKDKQSKGLYDHFLFKNQGKGMCGDISFTWSIEDDGSIAYRGGGGGRMWIWLLNEDSGECSPTKDSKRKPFMLMAQ